ncbi:hypothetical protein ES705_24355 [subsurface metagenome]
MPDENEFLCRKNTPCTRNKSKIENSIFKIDFDFEEAQQPLDQQFKSKNIDDKLKFIEVMLEVLSYFVDDNANASKQDIAEPNNVNFNIDESIFNDLCYFQEDLVTSSVYSATKLQSIDEVFLSDTIRIKPKYDTSGISKACKVAQHLYNDAYYVVKQVAFILDGNPNISWKILLSNFTKRVIIPNYEKSLNNCRIFLYNNPNASNEDLYKQFPNHPKSSLRHCRLTPKPYKELLEIKENEERNLIEINEIFNRLKNIRIKLKSKNLSNLFYDLGFLFKYTSNYKKLYSRQSKWVLHSLVDDLKSYYAILNKFNNKKLENEPSFPSWRDSEHRLLYGKYQLNNKMKEKKNLMIKSIRASKSDSNALVMDLHLPCKSYEIPNITISLRHFSDEKDFFSRCSGIEIVPRENYYELKVIYTPIYQKANLDYNKALSIDFGGTNIIASANNCGLNPELIKGKSLKKVLYFKNVISAKKTSTYKICENLLNRYKHKGKSEKFLDMIDYHISIAEQRRNNTSFVKDQKNNPKILYLYKQIENMNALIYALKDDCIYTNADIKKAENEIDYIKSNYDKKLIIYNRFKNALSDKSIEDQEQFLKCLLDENKEEYYRILNYCARRINKETHKITRYVIDYCINHKIGNIGTGYNKGWKKKTENLGKRFNRLFQSIPHYTLLQQLKYKAELVGINFVTVPEPYTSQSSAMDYEPIEKRPKSKRMGIRGVEIKCKDSLGNPLLDSLGKAKTYRARGLFYSKKSKKYIHSDINGAFNIGRLAFSDLFDNISQKDMLKNPRNIDL